MQVTSYNKEVLENKFLIERLIHKLQEAGKVSLDERLAVLLLFRKTLLRHFNIDPKDRLGVLLDAFSLYETRKVSILDNGVVSCVSSPKQIVPPNNLMLEKINSILERHRDIPPEFKIAATKYLLTETEAIADTGVNERVIDRFIETSLNAFKDKENFGQKNVPVIDIEDIKVVDKSDVFDDLPDKVAVDPESIKETTPKTVQQSEVQNIEQPKNEKKVEPKEVIVEESTQQKSKIQKDNDFKVHVTSGTNDMSSSNGKKKLVELILKQAREADKSNPLKSHQSEIPIPARRPKNKKFERLDVVVKKEIPKPPGAPRPIVPQVDGPGDVKLSHASNTKLIFDEKIDLESDRVLERHELRKQQEDLFSKYIKEQLETVMEVVSLKGVVGDEAQQKFREEIMRDVQKIIKNSGISMSKKLHELEDMFARKRNRYAVANQVKKGTSIEEMVDSVMSRVSKDIHTGNLDADERFKETLRNTLYFKAKHLIGVNVDMNKVQSALDEEYVKHKTFYLKNIK